MAEPGLVWIGVLDRFLELQRVLRILKPVDRHARLVATWLGTLRLECRATSERTKSARALEAAALRLVQESATPPIVATHADCYCHRLRQNVVDTTDGIRKVLVITIVKPAIEVSVPLVVTNRYLIAFRVDHQVRPSHRRCWNLHYKVLACVAVFSSCKALPFRVHTEQPFGNTHGIFI
jgi:hypothetical protein